MKNEEIRRRTEGKKLISKTNGKKKRPYNVIIEVLYFNEFITQSTSSF